MKGKILETQIQQFVVMVLCTFLMLKVSFEVFSDYQNHLEIQSQVDSIVLKNDYVSVLVSVTIDLQLQSFLMLQF